MNLVLETGCSDAAPQSSRGTRGRRECGSHECRARTLLTPHLLLLEPKFVKVFWIPESENPDDDKIYFFFRESAVEAAPALGRLSVSRVGQICRVRSPWAISGDQAPALWPVWASPSCPLIDPTE